jgi:hypothetical protein
LTLIAGWQNRIEGSRGKSRFSVPMLTILSLYGTWRGDSRLAPMHHIRSVERRLTRVVVPEKLLQKDRRKLPLNIYSSRDAEICRNKHGVKECRNE